MRAPNIVCRGFLTALLALTGLSVSAQNPPAQPQPATQTKIDPLGRQTPRGTVTGFTSAVARDDIDTAAQFMQLRTAADRRNAESLARDLNELLNRSFTGTIVSLSASPEGVPNDGLPLNRERLPLTLSTGEVDLQLVRIQDAQAGQIWLISADTLARVPALRRSVEATWLERQMPEALIERTVLGISMAQWTGWAVSIASPLLVLWLASTLFIAISRRSVRDLTRRVLLESWYARLRWPVIVVVTALVHFAVMPYLGFSLRFRAIYLRYALVAFVVMLSLLIWRFMTLSFEHARLMADRRGRASAGSLLLLAERLFKVVVVLVAIFVVLRIAGFDMTTALAGVGIGGVAIAFGAQKSVENLLGGIFLLTDKTIAVGDFCSISDRVGWIEDITLRSVRLRTVDQTLLCVPAGALSQSNIENFTTRRKILIQTTLRLRYGTSTAQLRRVLDGVRRLLADHHEIESEGSRVRLLNFGINAIEIELFAYVTSSDYGRYLEVREQLLLQAAAVVESSGTAFAQPLQLAEMSDRLPLRAS